MLAAAKGIAHKACSLLKEHGGSVELKKSWDFPFYLDMAIREKEGNSHKL